MFFRFIFVNVKALYTKDILYKNSAGFSAFYTDFTNTFFNTEKYP